MNGSISVAIAIALLMGALSAPRASASMTLTFPPTADTLVRKDLPTRNFGSSSRLKVDNSPVTHTLLMFTVSGIGSGSITSARLRLYNVDGSGVGGRFYRAADTTWSESTVTWQSAPVADLTPVASLGAVSAGTWYEIDISALITGDGTYSLRAASTSSNGAEYTSRQGTAGFAPQLVVTADITPRALTVTRSGAGTGTVTSSPAGIDCGARCQASFGDGTTVTLTATPSPASLFVGWEGACAGTDACSMAMSADLSVTATFDSAPPTGVNDSAGWVVPCTLSHSLPDDPIVFPGQPGVSHLHDFLGGREVDADATYDQVVAGVTSCSESSGDTGGYWTPAVYLNSEKVDPAGSFGGHGARQRVYFRGSNLAPGTVVQTIPPDLRIIAGNGAAAGPSENPQLGRNMYYGCSDNSTGKLQEPPVCSTGIISVHVDFPNCWDGVHLDVPGHQSHMAYPIDRVCPSSHPVPLPRVIMRLEYPVGTSGGAISLASGPPYTLHGDFWNTWRQDRLDYLVANCLNTGLDCGKV